MGNIASEVMIRAHAALGAGGGGRFKSAKLIQSISSVAGHSLDSDQ